MFFPFSVAVDKKSVRKYSYGWGRGGARVRGPSKSRHSGLCASVTIIVNIASVLTWRIYRDCLRQYDGGLPLVNAVKVPAQNLHNFPGHGRSVVGVAD